MLLEQLVEYWLAVEEAPPIIVGGSLLMHTLKFFLFSSHSKGMLGLGLVGEGVRLR